MRNETVPAFRISPLPPDLPPRLRRDRLDDSGHALAPRFDGSPHQCRACLRLTKPDEAVLLVSYSPFASSHPYAEVGPVFIHESECLPYSETSSYPAEFPHDAVVLRAYDADEAIEDAAFVGKRPVEEVISELFSNPRVRTIHARNSTWGCFMFRIDRAPVAP